MPPVNQTRMIKDLSKYGMVLRYNCNRLSSSSCPNLKNGEVKSFDEIPGPPPTNALMFLIRHTPFLGGFDIQRLHEMNFKLFKMYGPIRKEVIPERFKVVLPTDPKDIETVLRSEGKYPNRTPFFIVNYIRQKNRDKYHGNIGLFSSDRDEWYSIRSKIQTMMMRPKIVASYLPEVNIVADDMIQLMKTNRKKNYQIDNFKKVLYNWALESLGVFALDMRFGCLNVHGSSKETRELIKAINDSVVGLTLTEMGVPTWKYFPTKGWRMLKRSQEFLRKLTVKRIKDIRNTLKTKSKDENLSFLEKIVADGKLTEGELLCFIMDLFMAGIDTTSHSVAFFIYNLSKHPEIQEKLYSEIMSIMPVPGEEITIPKLEKMKYFKACYKESMRVCSTVIGTSRILDNDVVLSNYCVPKGTVIGLQSMVTANLEMNIEEPTKFKPERWLERTGKPPMHPFAFLPFGYGPRMCIGKRVAEQEMFVLLVKIIQNFKLNYDGEMGIITRVVNIPDKPFNFQFIDR